MTETNPDTDNPHRRLPSVDALIQNMPAELQQYGHPALRDTLRVLLSEVRAKISAGDSPDTSDTALQDEAAMRLAASDEVSLKPVINLTGTVLHTNLGRASLPQSAIDAVNLVAGVPSNLEFDLASGERGDRESHVEALICELTGAEAATVVNNNAAAVLLTLNTLAMNKEVPVSRGELVEIGGSFRIPEVMQRSNCTLVEIGATNRTHLKDYRAAINDNTALLMKVHTSNYEVQGFTKAVPEVELAALAQEHQLPFVIDLGSGNLIDFAGLGLPDEPTASAAIASGADVITFSGDKLLGGPQAGLIAGRADLIAAIKKNPLKRALRLDKMTLAALAEVLKLYRHPEKLLQELPTLRQLTRPEQDIRAQAERLSGPLGSALVGFQVSTQATHSQIGSGSLPVDTLPSVALVIAGSDAQVRELSARMRELPTPVIGRIHKGALWLDCRCLEQESLFLEQLAKLQA